MSSSMSVSPPPAPAASSNKNVSQLLAHSSGLISWSGCGRYLAVAKDTRLTVRDIELNMAVVQIFTCVDMISAIQWAPSDATNEPNMQLIFCAMYKRAIVQVFSVVDPSWTCKIAEGICGLISALWTPDTCHVITVSDFRIHATVWSLADATKYVIRNPKLGADGFSFSPDGTYLAVAERIDCKDAIGIYSVESWELIRHFDVASYDVVEISWSLDGRAIVLRDTFLEYRLVFYSVDGALLHQYEPYQHALGVKTMTWSPTGHFLAVGSFDEKVRVISHMHWKPIAELDHPTLITSNATMDIYKEEKGQWSQVALPCTVPSVSPDPTKEMPKVGVGVVAWSHDAAYMATKNDSMPHHIWIWRTDSMELCALLASSSPIKTFRWSPTRASLAFGCGTPRVCFWSPDGISWYDIPQGIFVIPGRIYIMPCVK
ncbi:hypothetical protein AeMF1_002924 [Aphanomyces euteiches]|nr:hypothetical protein AeMF1_002924 [Aphanomyces euteiches]KAH9192324.1 hypothetical protein AeNC1_005698 [Aphanomyces euteiches]